MRVRTAIPLPDDLRARLVARISELTGRAVDIDTIVDPAIVGGVVIETDGSVVDASVHARLADLRRAMLHTSVRDASGRRRQRLNRREERDDKTDEAAT